jgi:hypothetical protein
MKESANILKIITTIISLIGIFTFGHAQTNPAKNNYSIGGGYFQGKILQHDKYMAPISWSQPQGFELFIKKHATGKNAWEQYLNFPDLGFNLTYLNYNNPVLGVSIAGMGTFDYYIFRNRTHGLFFQLGAGLVYSSTTFHPIHNPENIAISLPISYALQSRLGYNLKLHPNWSFMPAITMFHYSNGAFKVPNKGINLPVINAGIAYHFNPTHLNHTYHQPDPELSKKIYHEIIFATGLKETYPVGGNKFPFFTISALSTKKLSPSNAIKAGIELFQNTAIRQSINQNERFYDGSQRPDFRRAGFSIGHELMAGNLSLITQLGYYFYKPFDEGKNFYQRYGLRYYCSKRYFVNMSLKSHVGKADGVEWGIGMRI